MLTILNRLPRAAAWLAAVLLFFPVSASALSVKEWEALANDHQRAAYVGNFVEKMTSDIGVKNPDLCQAIRHWFAKPLGNTSDDGITKLGAQVWALDEAAKEGKADLAKIQIEGVIVKVIKDKFLPKTAAHN